MVAVFVLDHRLRCGFINNVAEFLVGLRNVQAVGRHIGELLRPDLGERFARASLAGR